MKILSAGVLLFLVSFAYAAVSLDDIVKLSKAKTSDEIILQVIQKEGLTRPVTSKDIVYLKQHGVSDRVIQYLVKLSDTDANHLDKNMRAYYTTSKNGKRIRVVTNLDEKGKRMGGEIPPDPEPPQQQAVVYERSPQEIRIIVENESRRDERYEEDYPEYVDDRYIMPGYSLYSPYYSTPYYPYYPKQHHHRKGGFRDHDLRHPNWHIDYSRNRPLVRPRHQESAPNRSPNRSPGPKSPAKPFRSFKG